MLPSAKTRISMHCHQLVVATSVNNNARPQTYGRGQANHVDYAEASNEPTIVMGTLPVNSTPASVLFDSGASHSFISEKFAFMHGITI